MPLPQVFPTDLHLPPHLQTAQHKASPSSLSLAPQHKAILYSARCQYISCPQLGNPTVVLIHAGPS
jgi:hypothetical protein